jgi:hypothetical protein
MSESVTLWRLETADWPAVHWWGRLRHTMLIRDGRRDSSMRSMLEDERREGGAAR